jgi:tRNA(Ile)-lysidine synthetase-like protein
MTSFRTFWFQASEYWFGCPIEFDEYLRMTFGELHSHISSLPIDFELSLDEILERILILDQLSRHLYRNDRTKMIEWDQKAVQYTDFLIQNKKIEEYLPAEKCFVLMPFRHTFQKNQVQIVFDFIKKWHDIEPHQPIYRRFYTATLQSLSKINTKMMSLYPYTPSRCYIMEEIDHVLDTQSKRFMECMDFDNDTKIDEDPLYLEFVKNLEFYKMEKDKKIVISLSGGVDSMVVSFIVAKWFQKLILIQKKNISIEAVTIDYANREEQKVEIFMIHQWCKKLGIDHYVREINEIHRTRDSDRDIYESITRDIRFGMYQERMEKEDGIVLLGHNRDDTLENVFSNIKKRRSYQNLYGMQGRIVEKDVSIVRPMLKIWKSDIVRFAKEYFIPFVYDSTPSWSERGKMRDILVPQIRDFSEDLLNGIFDMVDNFSEIYQIYEKMVPDIHFHEKECEVKDMEIYFYEYLKKIVYRIQIHYVILPIKNKSILHLCESLKMKNSNRITLSKELIAQKKGDLIHFYLFK